MKKLIYSTDIQAVKKVIQAVLLQVDFLSDCGLDVCLAVTAPKCVQFWTNRTWRGDLTEVMKYSANQQAGLDECNNNLDMFVEMKSSESANRLDHMPQDNQTDTPPAPVNLPYDIIPEDQTSEACAMGEAQIMSEPENVDPIITEADDRSCMDGSACEVPPAPATPSDDVSEEHTTGSYVIKKESMKAERIDTDWTGNEAHHGDSCLEREVPPAPATPSDDVSEEHTSGSYVIKKESMKAERIDTDWTENEAHRGDSCLKEHASAASATSHDVVSEDQTSKLYVLEEHTRPEPANCNEIVLAGGGNSMANDEEMKSHMRCNTEDGERRHITFRDKQLNAVSSTRGPRQTAKREATKRKYRCTEHITEWRRNLTQHMTTHTLGKSKMKKLKCSECEYSTGYGGNMKRHMRLHSGERPYHCKFCNYKAAQGSSLQQHMRKHTGNTFNCEHCDYKSNLQSNLNTHMRRHTGETFNCEQCDYKSIQLKYLHTHIKRHHPEHSN